MRTDSVNQLGSLEWSLLTSGANWRESSMTEHYRASGPEGRLDGVKKVFTDPGRTVRPIVVVLGV